MLLLPLASSAVPRDCMLGAGLDGSATDRHAFSQPVVLSWSRTQESKICSLAAPASSRSRRSRRRRTPFGEFEWTTHVSPRLRARSRLSTSMLVAFYPCSSKQWGCTGNYAVGAPGLTLDRPALPPFAYGLHSLPRSVFGRTSSDLFAPIWSGGHSFVKTYLGHKEH